MRIGLDWIVCCSQVNLQLTMPLDPKAATRRPALSDRVLLLNVTDFCVRTDTPPDPDDDSCLSFSFLSFAVSIFAPPSPPSSSSSSSSSVPPPSSSPRPIQLVSAHSSAACSRISFQLLHRHGSTYTCAAEDSETSFPHLSACDSFRRWCVVPPPFFFPFSLSLSLSILFASL